MTEPLRISGTRDSELTATYAGMGADIRLDWWCGQVEGFFREDQLRKLRDWITETFGEAS